MQPYGAPSDIRVGVVGYGPAFNMGRFHLNAMKSAGMTPVAVADIDPARLPVAEEEFPGIRTFSSATELLANCDVDLLGIITPHDSHAALALECLAAGKHVVTEKPFCITTAECDAMIDLARANGLMLSVHHNRHWDGWIIKAVENIVTRGMIGDVLRIDAHTGQYSAGRDWWRSSKSISGGISYDWGAHFLEYALQLIDSEITEVSGFAQNGYWAPQSPWGDDTIEDEMLTIVRFASGQCLTMLNSRIESHPRPGWFDITGTTGSYHFDTQGWHATIQEGDAVQVRSGPNAAAESWRFYRNIAAHLLEGEPLVITPEWARRTIHIMDLASQSSDEGVAKRAKYV